MIDAPVPLKIGYVLKRFPRLSETFILNEILELERRGTEVVIYAYLRPNEGRFHAQIADLRARVHYLEGLDPRRWHEWLAAEWPVLGPRDTAFWEILRDSLQRADSLRFPEIVWGAWVASQAIKDGVQHLHSHFGTMSSTIAWFASRISGVPFTFTAHAKDIYAYSLSEHRLGDKLEAASRVITVTHFNRRHLLEQQPDLDPDAVRVVYNGIDLDRFAPDPAVRRDGDLILSVGRLIPKKGFDDLLDACAHLKHRGIPFRCMIVGDGPDEPSLLQKRLLLDLGSEVEFLGARPQHEVVHLMRRATLLALACKDGPDKNRDALPTVLLEALACGLPIVSTDFSGIPEIVDSGVDGFLVDPGDATALADRIAALFAAPDLRARFARAGRDKAERKFDLHRNAGQLLGIFQQSVRRSRPVRPQSTAADPARGRVLVLSTDRGLPFGSSKGGSVHLREFATALQAAGWEPTVVVGNRDPGSSYQPTYPVHTLSRPLRDPGDNSTAGSIREAEGFRNQAVQTLLADLHRAHGIDLLYERYSLFGTGGRMLAQKLGLPYVLEVNSPLVEEAEQFRGLEDAELARDVARYLFATADHVVAVSSEIEAYVLGLAPHARVSVVPNGVHLQRFKAATRNDAWRARLARHPEKSTVVGFLGRVRPWHGVEALIDAVAGLDEAVHLCIVGVADDMFDALAQRAAARGIEARFRLIEPLPPEAVPHVLQAMDVLVAPYPQLERFYFSPLKVFEYMASGRPIVASGIGQVREILEHERTALLVAPGSVAALAQAIQRLRSEPALASRLGDAARSEAERLHGWENRLEVLAKLFTRLIAPRRHAREETYAADSA